jgi:hypothetical protein
VDSGTLPTGITLDSDGTLHGTATANDGTASVTVRLTDANGPALSVTKVLSVTVLTPPSITTTTLPAVTIGDPYSTSLVGTGTGTLVWTLDSGTLPSGLTLDSDGTLHGTATADDGTAQITVRLTDDNGAPLSVTKTFDLTVA